MAGQMGNVRVTTQNLKVVKVDVANHLLVVKGAVPGPKNALLEIRKSFKKKSQAKKEDKKS
jgi:large subunit ribosomal protein L3